MFSDLITLTFDISLRLRTVIGARVCRRPICCCHL